MCFWEQPGPVYAVNQCWGSQAEVLAELIQPKNILKAPGTPMMRPLSAASSLARLTLLAGEPSVRASILGILSPAWMNAGREEWKALAEATDDLAASPRGRIDDLIKAIVNCNWQSAATDDGAGKLVER